MKAIDIAYNIVKHYYSDFDYEDQGEIMSNLKLQKLLYYYQGFHLAFFERPAFDEDIYAWQYGPVVPEVYHSFADKRASIIKTDDFNEQYEEITDQQKQLLHVILDNYGQLNASALMNLSHQETPWKSTELLNIISSEKLTSFFKTKIVR